jgi:hypothetical protein
VQRCRVIGVCRRRIGCAAGAIAEPLPEFLELLLEPLHLQPTGTTFRYNNAPHPAPRATSNVCRLSRAPPRVPPLATGPDAGSALECDFGWRKSPVGCGGGWWLRLTFVSLMCRRSWTTRNRSSHLCCVSCGQKRSAHDHSDATQLTKASSDRGMACLDGSLNSRLHLGHIDHVLQRAVLHARDRCASHAPRRWLRLHCFCP